MTLRAPARPPSVLRWFLDVGPLAAVLIFVWAKRVYFTALVPNAWWAGPGSTWMRPAWHVIDAIGTHPEVLIATLASLLIMMAPLLLLPALSRFLTLLALDFLLTSLGLVDLVHAQFYADVVSLSDAVVAPMIVGVLPRVLESVSTLNAIYYLDILAGLLLVPWYRRASRHTPPLGRQLRTALTIGLVSTGLVLAVPTIRMLWRGGSEALESWSPRLDVVPVIGLLPYHLSDVAVRLARGQPSLGESEHQHIRRFLDERSWTRQTPSPLFGRARGRNVIVVNAESLSAFPMGLAIDGQPVTPRLTEFARESLSFVNFYDQTHLGTTSDAEFGAMQSLHPLAAGVLASRFYRNKYRGLPRILAERGYTTVSACAAGGWFWNMWAMHPSLGFQRSFFEKNYQPIERIGSWLSDRQFFAQTVPILKAQPAPFMAFLLTSSVHHPFRLPPPDRALALGSMEGTLLGDYLQLVRYFDRAFGEFVEQLRQAGLLETSVIVVYGDHHAFLSDPPGLGRLLGFADMDEFRALQIRKRLPLLIRLPHGEAAGVQTAAGGHLDIGPTVLSLLGVSDSSSVMLGTDLTRGRDSLVVFRDGSFTDGATWYVRRIASKPPACFDAKTGRSIDCSVAAERRREAQARLQISDLIIRGDLIPILTQRKTRNE